MRAFDYTEGRSYASSVWNPTVWEGLMDQSAEQMEQTKEFASFKEFYPFYLSEHSDVTCRRLHFVGSALVLVVLAAVILNSNWVLLWTLPVIGYGFAWVGHFFFEKNRPATFKYPFYSLMGDWVMFKDILIGRVSLLK